MEQARLAVLCSGVGSNLAAIIEAVKAGKLTAKIVCVLSDNPQARCLERAQRSEIPAIILDPKKYPNRSAFDQAILSQLRSCQAEWVILAGFMRLLGAGLVSVYRNRVLNIHPALLPEFRGLNAIRRAWEAKVPFTGVTVHFVNEEMDAGPVIVQEKVEINPGESLESLEKRIHEVEHRLYPRTIQKIITGELQ